MVSKMIKFDIEIYVAITNLYKGMFLWVRLVAHELKYCYSDTALEETATRLPQGLKAA